MTSDINSIAHAIELALAPVFLLVAVGAMLNVLTTRLSRAVDRSRVLQGRAGSDQDLIDDSRDEQEILSTRMRIINVAVIMCVVCALLICSVVAIIFIASIVNIAVSVLIVSCFVAAMLSLIGALLCLLREIYLATRKMPIKY
ncbi:MAG: DUF2721 domain-containing protein [Gammaproteobacteria bacterium]